MPEGCPAEGTYTFHSGSSLGRVVRRPVVISVHVHPLQLSLYYLRSKLFELCVLFLEEKSKREDSSLQQEAAT